MGQHKLTSDINPKSIAVAGMLSVCPMAEHPYNLINSIFLGANNVLYDTCFSFSGYKVQSMLMVQHAANRALVSTTVAICVYCPAPRM